MRRAGHTRTFKKRKQFIITIIIIKRRIRKRIRIRRKRRIKRRIRIRRKRRIIRIRIRIRIVIVIMIGAPPLLVIIIIK